MEIIDNLGFFSVIYIFFIFFVYIIVIRFVEIMGFYGSMLFEKIFRYLCNGNGGKNIVKKIIIFIM